MSDHCRSYFLLIFLDILWISAFAQPADSSVTKTVAAVVQLDPVVVTATRQGFDVEDFIRLVQEDESLYEAFHNLRTASYHFVTDMYFYDKRGDVESEYHSSADQISDGRCRTMHLAEESFSGRFVKGKSGKHRYYTFKLYDRVFLTHGRQCETTSGTEKSEGDSRLEGHIGELKRLIFSPGRRANVPFIGRKTEIFSEHMLPYYDFHIRSDTSRGIPVYVFVAEVKEDYADRENKTVYKRLETSFAKADFQVIARKYRLSHDPALYVFDVEMAVDLTRVGDKYFPTYVRYDGTWNVPTRRRETGVFEVFLEGFE